MWWRQWLVVWVEWLSLAGLGPGGPFGHRMVARGVRIRFLVRGWWLVRGGWPLAVGGVCGWSARWLPSRPLVLFVHGGLWPGGVGRWAVVVVGVVLVVVVVGSLVVVVWVVVELVLRVWPMDPLWVFWSPLWGWGVGHRGQSPGLHYVVGRGEGLGAGLDGDGGRGVPRPWVGLAGGGGGLWGMQWKVVPMGAKNGNAAFQRMMEDLLGPVRHCADPFVDDIIIGSGTEDMTEDELIEAHEKDLRRVLSELDKQNMVCKRTKASLFVKEVEFAGHVVGHGQRRPMPGKLASLHHWEKPQTISEL